MIVELESIETGALLDTDVCVVGAGAAGITVARELIGSGIRVIVLEGGGHDYEEAYQDLYAGRGSTDYPPLDISRLRMFGGTTNHWSGSCGPLEADDFERRSWLPHSGWPISRRDLDAYYAKAQKYCEIGPFRYDADYWARQLDVDPLPGLDIVQSAVAQSSPPTNFASAYGDDLANAQDVRVILHANVIEFVLDEDAAGVSAVQVANLAGEETRVTARLFVLATGGIENARLLLASNTAREQGLGNGHDLVGRFYMDHPVVKGAELLATNPEAFAFYQGHRRGGHRVHGYLRLDPAFARDHHLLNARMTLIPQTKYYMSKGIASFHEIMADTCSYDLPDHAWQHFENVVTDIDMVAESGWRKAVGGSLFDYADDRGGFVVEAMIEQVPLPDRRVELSGDRDSLGVPRVKVNWWLDQAEIDNLWSCYEALGAEIGRSGIGRVRTLGEFDRVLEELLGFGHHHSGTTRMASTARRGVVDPDLRVFETSNLFVVGSSVFPTSGHVPPTLTIVALAIRLAGHIKDALRALP